ncbi:MAG: matrixin family metalloprotease [Bacteroidota bacterium]|nr:matrixin family metalloprotease [Bacteroidota bacterium]MDX5404530.1 matrixin family metalloprotease [Bacteroidota bacterium]MDX5447548.1 matrixin family metalloprotease [Bacteroidota bacterium]
MRLIWRSLILLILWSCSESGPSTIGIQPYENIPEEWMTRITTSLEREYGCKVVVLDKKDLPASAFVRIKSPRYRADSIIRILKRERPDSVDLILGITQKDISTTKYKSRGIVKEPKSKYQDWGIFGLGYRPGPSCIISGFRLKGKGNKVTLDRLERVSIHEIGHNLGLPHCPNRGCVMEDAAETIRTIDRVNPHLCSDCKRRIGIR